MGSDEDSSGECFKLTWARVTLGKSFEGSSLQLGRRSHFDYSELEES